MIEGPNAGQAEYWSTNGQSWIAHETLQDQLLYPVTDLLLGLSDIKPGQRVLDIGCGTGAHTLAVAAALGPKGRVTALDVSEPLLNRAIERFAAADAPVRAVLGDAQMVELPREFHLATSRFGVMFFADPAAAFANIARAIRPGGRMIFSVWGPVSENPWWRLPLNIGKARLGSPEPTPPNAPGPMGLADVGYLEDQLSDAGLSSFTVTPTTIALGTKGGPAEMAAQSIRIGPAARLIRLFDATLSDVQVIEDDLTRAYEDYADNGQFALPARLNIIDIQIP